MASFAIAVCCLLCVAGTASAYPWRWLVPPTGTTLRPGACGKHPTVGFGPHLPPEKDSATTFVVTKVGSKVPVPPKSPLCPGNKYTIKVSWDSTLFNHALLTTSVGKWAKPPLAACPVSTYNLAPATSFTDTVVIPCTAKGKATFKVTHSQPGQAYLQQSVTYTVSSKCAAKSCPKPKSPPPKKTG